MPRRLGCPGSANRGDDLVDVVEGLLKTFEDVGSSLRAIEFVLRPAGKDFLPVTDVLLECTSQGENARLRAVLDQGEKVDAERLLQGGVFEQVVEHLHRLRVALELDDGAHPGAVGFVAEIADAVEFAVLDEFGDPLHQRRLVDLIGQFGDDDLVTVAPCCFLDEGFGADHHATAAGVIGGANTLAAENRAAGREVRSLDEFHQLVDRCLGIVDEMDDGIADFVQVMWRDIGCHPDGDTGTAIDQEIGQPRR